MHELVIVGGTVVDGTGRPGRRADVAVSGGVITAVGDEVGAAARRIDAEGCLVTPGWVDPHTHYDGQASWDAELSPSAWHGVTTAVLGNCGVGFAPARPDRREWLIGLMEGVEDIPAAVLSAGIRWEWESFADYLDALDRTPRTLDVAAQLPHGAVRAYVMGERGARNERATDADIAAMAAIVRDGLRAGAVGFTTSRTPLHRASDGEPVPGTFADPSELLGIGAVLGETGSGVVGVATSFADEAGEIDWMTRLSVATGRPVTFALTERDTDPEQWRRLLAAVGRAHERGARLVPQVAGRPTGMLMGLEGTVHPFIWASAYAEIAGLPPAARLERLRDPEVRRRILEEPPPARGYKAIYASGFARLFPLGDPPDYEPAPDASVAALARRRGVDANALAYDLLVAPDGPGLLYFPMLGYTAGDFEVIRAMLADTNTVLGLADGGAHCGFVCDAGQPTFMLTHWARDRRRGPRLAVEAVVRMLSAEPAELFGFADRGVVTAGRRADLNVIDFDGLHLLPPEMRHDLPGGGKRLVQQARGYRATLVAGRLTYEDGVPTGARPGHLVRGGVG